VGGIEGMQGIQIRKPMREVEAEKSNSPNNNLNFLLSIIMYLSLIYKISLIHKVLEGIHISFKVEKFIEPIRITNYTK
jgi:hypothetical protein